MDIHKLVLEKLNWRYAAKEFDTNKKVDEETLDTLLHAINLTPTSLGLQGFKVLVSDKESVKNTIREATFNQKQVQTCSHNIIFCIKTDIDSAHIDNYIAVMAKERNVEISDLQGYKQMCIGFLNTMDDAKKLVWLKHQVYIVLGNFINTCALLGVDCCPLEGFNPLEVDRLLNLEEKNLHSVVMCPIGYRSENDTLGGMKKVRFPKSETIINI